ncbi:sulfite oxidase [Mycolicibacterium sediminis]|uniref:Sulfite oxidase n=1 Tax=Mycolicibacterium sediminis TaxID=1286180 RepID=A0A7I7QT02_9MYCO|nr:sulfite oxidase [Mycolicibacterium sediminis]BBY29117.1 sulfite oxidase [Mycolicibacterium sediminis]
MTSVRTWGKRPGTVVQEAVPFNAEAAAAALADEEITPVDVFYARNHGPIPDVAANDWRLVVDGLVDAELDLSLDRLTSEFAEHEVTATLQCAGNRRDEFVAIRPIPGEDPWGPGATSTARWHGARLADVLASAGVTDADDLHVEFTAPDVAADASPAQAYGSSIPLRKALSREVLLAWRMNDEPLPRLHGGPVRVVVPGFIGARSVKWVHRITVRDSPSDNYFQASAYRLLPADADPGAGAGEGIPLSSIGLNSAILCPADGAVLPPGPVTVSGYALGGDDREIARVDVSADGGATWRPAELSASRGPWAWRFWSFTVDLVDGTVDVVARAWDDRGGLQSESTAALWNPKGYANYSWPRRRIVVGRS